MYISNAIGTFRSQQFATLRPGAVTLLGQLQQNFS